MINHPNRSKRTAAATSTPTKTKTVKAKDHRPDDYHMLALACQRSYNVVAAANVPLFRVAVPSNLFDIFLKCLPPARRQEHTCSCCRGFVNHFGGLVAVSETGKTHSVMFSVEVPDLYKKAFAELKATVEGRKITGPFLTGERIWGRPVAGSFEHMSVSPVSAHVHNSRLRNAGQEIANKVHALKNVKAGLAEYSKASLDELLRMLKAEHLNQSKAFIGPVQWLRDLHDLPKGPAGTNLLWYRVMTAPEGFTHPRSAVWASVLDDINAGRSFEDMKRSFNYKVRPDLYQRPQAAPAEQNIKRAEEIVRKLGIENSLKRRFARLDEVVAHADWVPSEEDEDNGKNRSGGVFSHLKPKGERIPPSVNLPSQRLTWAKFARDVLPHVKEMQLNVPHLGRFIAITTAQYADSPPILKWDSPEFRNPFAWYVYMRGSPASRWSLEPGSWRDITAVVPLPPRWYFDMLPQYDGVILTLEDCWDKEVEGNALFPECLKSELHEVRSTIEAFSASERMGGGGPELASGYDLRNQPGQTDCILRAFVHGGWQQYQIDRWD